MTDEWIATYTGRQFWPLAPRAVDVAIEDIAHALANKCRFTGHTRRFYSVAQHSVHVSHHVDAAGGVGAGWGLLHDGAEAYLPDVASPVKHLLHFEIPQEHGPAVNLSFEAVERRILWTVAEALGLPRSIPEKVWEVDRRMLATERRDLFGEGPEWPALRGVRPYSLTLPVYDPEEAEELFLFRWRELEKTLTA